MNLLTLDAAGARFGLDLSAVDSVLARPPLRPLAGAPAWCPGVFRLRGQFVPVVDLGVLHGGTPSRAAYASRVVVVHYPTPSGEHRPLGLLAEQVTDVVTLDERDLSSSGVSMPETPWLGAMAPAGGGPIQLVHVADLLNGEARARLFSGEEPSGG